MIYEIKVKQFWVWSKSGTSDKSQPKPIVVADMIRDARMHIMSIDMGLGTSGTMLFGGLIIMYRVKMLCLCVFCGTDG